MRLNQISFPSHFFSLTFHLTELKPGHVNCRQGIRSVHARWAYSLWDSWKIPVFLYSRILVICLQAPLSNFHRHEQGSNAVPSALCESIVISIWRTSEALVITTLNTLVNLLLTYQVAIGNSVGNNSNSLKLHLLIWPLAKKTEFHILSPFLNWSKQPF